MRKKYYCYVNITRTNIMTVINCSTSRCAAVGNKLRLSEP